MVDKRRSSEALEWQWVYTSRRWRKLRPIIFTRDLGICGMCSTLIIGTFHMDHKIAHKGNEALIWDEANLQVLHPRCHDSLKQQYERSGFIRGVDEDGKPIDKNHPWSRAHLTGGE